MRDKRLFLAFSALFFGLSLSTVHYGPLFNMFYLSLEHKEYIQLFSYLVLPITILIYLWYKHISIKNKLLYIRFFAISILLALAGLQLFTNLFIQIFLSFYLGTAFLILMYLIVSIYPHIYSYQESYRFIGYTLIISTIIVIISLYIKTIDDGLALLFCGFNSMAILIIGFIMDIEIEKNTVNSKELNVNILLQLFLFVLLLNIGDGYLFALNQSFYKTSMFLNSIVFFLVYLISSILMVTFYKQLIKFKLLLSLTIALMSIGFIFSSFDIYYGFLIQVCVAILDIFVWTLALQMNFVIKKPLLLVIITMGANSLASFIGLLLFQIILSNQSSHLLYALGIIASLHIISIVFVPNMYNELKGFSDRLELLMHDRRNVVFLEEVAKEYSLTKRESEIFCYLIENKTYKEISENLIISINTTKTHIKHIYSKFEVDSKKNLIEFIEKLQKNI